MEFERNSSQAIFAEYEKGKSFNLNQDLYSRIEENEKLFLGKHWDGVEAPSFDKPVFNIVKRVVSNLIAMIVADDFAVSISPFFPTADNKAMVKILENEIERIFEQTHFRAMNRDFLRNVAIDGDCYFVQRFDQTIETGQESLGAITIEKVDSIDMIFGNPYDTEVQNQPYILIVERRNIESLKNELEIEGIEYEESEIVPDDDNPTNDENKVDDSTITVIHKYYKERKNIFYTRVIKNKVLTNPIDLRYTRYPVASMVWEKVRNSYHGWSVVDGIADNQYAINNLMAAGLESVKMNARPATVYDSQKVKNIKGQFKPGGYIEATGDVNDVKNVIGTIKGEDMSPQLMQMVGSFSDMTKELMGASDATLGNIRPDNASAIIAAQRATAAPLDLQIQSYRKTIEEIVRNMAEIIVKDYGKRMVWVEDFERTQVNQMGQPEIARYTGEMPVDFGEFIHLVADVNVDIGAGAYYSEILQMQTLDNVMNMGLIADTNEYINAVPSHMLPNKHKILESNEAKQAEAMQMQQMQTQQSNAPQVV